MSKRRKEAVEALVSAAIALMEWDVNGIAEGTKWDVNGLAKDMAEAQRFKADWRDVAEALTTVLELDQ